MILAKPKKRRHSILLKKEDIFADIEEKKGSTLFLGKYTFQEAGRVLQKRNFVNDARNRGLWPIKVSIDSTEFPPLQRLRMYHEVIGPEKLVMDLKIKESRLVPKTDVAFTFSPAGYTFLVLDWLTLQNPLLNFSPEKTPLPGQKYPGLGLGRKVIQLLIYLARLNRNAGILVFPCYFHNAILFSRRYKFLNPLKQAEVEAIRTAFPELSLKQLAWIVHLNCLRKERNVYEWEAEEMVCPLAAEIRDYFASKEYVRMIEEARDNQEFTIAWKCYRDRIIKQPYFSDSSSGEEI